MDFCKRDSIYIPPSTCDECVSPTDYNDLRNHPSINGVELEGNVTSDELNLVEKDGNKVLSDENFSTSDKIKLDNIESGAQANVIESVTVDGVGLPVIAKEVDIPAMVGATASAPGAAGVVPAPSAGDEQKFLRGDGTWQTAGGGGGSYTGVAPIDISGSVISHDDSGVTAASKGDTTNQTPAFGGTFKALSGTVDAKGHLTAFDEHTVTIPDDVATTSANGLMSATDKATLDDVENTYVPNTRTVNGQVLSADVSLYGGDIPSGITAGETTYISADADVEEALIELDSYMALLEQNIPPTMTILSYGHSTWQDFMNAYTTNTIVYCRASTNSNPGTGSQTRLAFMAYVNNETNPTNVEFQYYRSMSSHSDSAQGDEVYVYKLTNSNTWTVTKRNAYTKIVAGTNMSSTYNNGTLTLSASGGGATPATSSPLMDGTADVGTSTAYAREDHVHPTDTSRASTATATTASDGLMSSSDKSKLDGIGAGAEANQDAFSTVTVGGVDIDATATTDAFELIAGTNVTLTPDAVNKTVTIDAAGGGSSPSPASALPIVDGTAAVGTSTAYAREDHVHPTDTSRAPLASPAFTGTPTAPTAALSEDSTIIATTEYVRDVFRDIDPVPRIELVPTAFSGTNASNIGGNCHGMYIPVLKLAILTFNFTLSSGSAGTSTNLFTIPSAYRPSATVYGSGYGKSSSATGGLHVSVNSSGQVRQGTMSACTGGNGMIVYQVA